MRMHDQVNGEWKIVSMYVYSRLTMDHNRIEILQVPRKIMSFLFKTPGQDNKYDGLEVLIYITLFLTFSTSLVPCTLHFVHNKSENTISLNEGVEDLTDMIAISSLYIIIFYFLYNNQKITTFFDDLRNFNNSESVPQLQSTNRIMNMLCIAYIGFGMIGTVFYYILKTILDKSCQENNVKYNKNDLCGYITPTWLPFTVKPPFNVALAVLQIYSVAAPAGITCTTLIFSIGCSEFIILRIRHLNGLLAHVFVDGDLEASERNMNWCIKYHKNIISLADRFNDCFSLFYFFYCADSGSIISMTGFSFIVKPSIPTLLLLFGWAFGIFILTVSGQRLIDESLSICDAVYDTNWYDFNKSTQMSIKLIMLKAQSPLRQHAWKFTQMSFNTLKEIFKTSYSMLALLNRVYNTEE